MRRLIFNADDYGLTPGVSAGILAARAGVVRATTVLANLAPPAALHALADSGLSIGCHLNLSLGRPLSPGYPAELLDPAGNFVKALALDPATWEPPARRDTALAEWEAQLWRLEQAGLRLDHLDSHHHAHLLDPLFRTALGLARRWRLALRCDSTHLEAARIAGVPATDSFIASFFGREAITREALLAALSRAEGETVEVMCHPGQADPALSAISSYVDERETELKLLGNPALAHELESAGWRLCGFNDGLG